MSQSIRIDKWLWFARCCRTRSAAQKLVEDGLVTVNGRLVEKSSEVAPGDEIAIGIGRASREDGTHSLRRMRVVAIGERRGPATIARTLYVDIAG